MATTVLIKTVEWSSNPVNTGQATLLKIQAAKAVTGIATAGEATICGLYTCGEEISIETTLTP